MRRMHGMRNTLLCTIGTSLLGNLKRLGEEHIAHQAFVREDYAQVAKALLKESPTARLCGAEVNSITSIVNSGHLYECMHLVFLVSDTPEAQIIAGILQHYYTHPENPIQFETVVSPITLKGLNDESPERFQREGLKSLVSEISSAVAEYSAEAIAINATGGYKAQISFAGMIGQALNIPVYYLFEGFSKAIELPPQPVSLDLTLWLTHYPLLAQLNTNDAVKKSAAHIDDSVDVLSALVDEIEMDGEVYLDLSAMGKLFFYRCEFQYKEKAKALLKQIPQTDLPDHKKKVALGKDHHGTDKLLKFSKKLCRSPYVEGIVHSLPYTPHQRDPILRISEAGKIEFVLTWTDAGYGLCIQSTANNKRDAAIVAQHLKEKFAQSA